MTSLLKNIQAEERKRFKEKFVYKGEVGGSYEVAGEKWKKIAEHLDQSIQRTVEKTVEEIKYWIYYMGDTSDYPSWGGAVGLTTGLIPKEKVLEVLTYLKSLPENKKDEVDRLLTHPTKEDK